MSDRRQLRQGDLVEVDGLTHVVVSRTCDLVEGRNPDAVAHIARVTDDVHPVALKGWNPRLVRIPLSDGELADMTTATPVPLAGLREGFLRAGCETAEQERAFRREVGRWLSMSSLPDDVHRSLRRLTRHIKDKADDEVLAALLQGVAHVRVRIDQLKAGGLSLHVLFITRGDLIDVLPAGSLDEPNMNSVRAAAEKLGGGARLEDLAALVVSYCEALADKIVATGAVVDVSHEVVSPHELTAANYLATEPLDLDLLSLDDDPDA